MSQAQGTKEWMDSRIGVVTASRFSSVLAGKTTASRENYKAEIVAERLTGRTPETYQSWEMKWGNMYEPEARAIYAELNGGVVETGLIKLPHMEAGASPDGLVGEDGGLEIKCPNTATHIKTLLSKRVPSQYIPQIQGGMWVTGRKWWDFVSYDPRLNDKNAYICIRVQRDDEYIARLEKEAKQFLLEVDQLIKELGE